MRSWNDQVDEDEVGWAYNANGGEEDRVQVIDGNARRKETAMKTKM
jgi:hypothetical protein